MATRAYDVQRGGLAAIGSWSLRGLRAPMPLAAVLAAVTAISLFSLLRTPPPFLDEVWFANRAWALVETGRAFGTMDSGVFDRYDGYWTYFPWLPTWFQALAIQAFGLSLSSVRLVSVAFGLVLLAAVYAIASHLGGRRLALLAVLVVSLSRAFLYSSHLARPDIIVAAFGFVAIALYTTDRSPGFSVKSLLSGFAVGLALEAHPFGVIYGPVIVALYLLDYGKPALRMPRLWGFVVGGGAGLALYAALHVLPYPQTYLTINALVATASGAVRTPPLLTPDPDVWLQSVLDMAVQFRTLWNLRVPLVLAGLVLLWRSRSPSDRRLLNLCAVLLLAYLALIRNKNPWYAILAAPAGDLLMAVALARLSRAKWPASLWARLPAAPLRRWLGTARLGLEPSRWSAVRTALVLVMLAAAVVPTLTRALGNPMRDYETTLAQVGEVVAPGSVVMGPATYWLGVPDRTYVSWEQLVYYRRYAPGSTVAEAVRAFRPDYFIVDPYIEQFIRDTPRPGANAQQLLLPKTPFEQFLGEHATLAAAARTGTYGNVRIYRIDWERS